MCEQSSQPQRPDTILVPVFVGELLDRISILEIKCDRISGESKRRNVQRELRDLQAIRDRSITMSEELSSLARELKRANEALWEAEDAIRLCEARREFGPRFVELARSIYRGNDLRTGLKRRINRLFGPDVGEEKSYPSYD